MCSSDLPMTPTVTRSLAPRAGRMAGPAARAAALAVFDSMDLRESSWLIVVSPCRNRPTRIRGLTFTAYTGQGDPWRKGIEDEPTREPTKAVNSDVLSCRGWSRKKGTEWEVVVYTEGVEAYYANIISYRVTAEELVLEFGSFFPGQDGRSEPNASDTTVRVVLNANVIEQFLSALTMAKGARDKHRSTARQRVEKKEVPSQ